MITLDQGGRAASSAVWYPAPSGLEGAVEEIWVVPRQPEAARAPWRVVADPNPHVLVHRFADGRTRAAVIGARSRHVDVDQAGRTYTVGVRLRVGALPLLRGPDATELLDRGARLADLFGREGEEVTDAIAEAAAPEEVVAKLAELLRRRVHPGELPDWRIRGFMAALAERPGSTIESVADRLGVSPRTLRATTRTHVGLGPKAVQRLNRLLAGLSTMRRSSIGGAGAALAAGYADHAHFVHECTALLGEPPRRFLARGLPADSDNGVGGCAH